MTFEDYELSLNLDLENMDDRYILDVSRNAWNAAIASSLNAVDVVVKQQIDENDVHVYIHDNIKKLLAA